LKEKEEKIYECLFCGNKGGFLTVMKKGAQTSPSVEELKE